MSNDHDAAQNWSPGVLWLRHIFILKNGFERGEGDNENEPSVPSCPFTSRRPTAKTPSFAIRRSMISTELVDELFARQEADSFNGIPPTCGSRSVVGPAYYIGVSRGSRGGSEQVVWLPRDVLAPS